MGKQPRRLYLFQARWMEKGYGSRPDPRERRHMKIFKSLTEAIDHVPLGYSGGRMEYRAEITIFTETETVDINRIKAERELFEKGEL